MTTSSCVAIALTAILVACGPDATGPTPEAAQVRVSPTPVASPAGGAVKPGGIWITASALASLPMAGPGWGALERQAGKPCGPVDLTNQDNAANVCVLSKALVFARTQSAAHKAEVLAALRDVAASPPYRGRALSLGRELAAYVIVADVIDLPRLDSELDLRFREAITGLLSARTLDGPGNLIECHEDRPNNWGTNCGASRAAVLAYLRDTAGLERVAQVFRGWLGDRSAYAGFTFGDLSWQCNSASPVAINPPGCERDGHSIDGVLPDDQRRAGPFAWPPPKENYVYEALQGAVVQAVILTQAGYPAFEWEQRALLRAFQWLDAEAAFRPGGDDIWIVPVLNHYYRTSYAVPDNGRPGKVMAWTEWTHVR